ncbi:MAG: pyridoxamine 5-phosphate oxidase [Alphaproteobacteria bacterium RIFOXYD12_FULL_60_8]|nr:MAG: pyridoxamine 5-phosphate oxidase [Alphaproteobacteria bacterium RIFOXYD12_FULL_60_8]
MFYELAATSWGPEEIAAIQRVIASDRYTMGVETAAFEAEFAAYMGMKYAVMVNSGSSANLIATAALCSVAKRPLKRGDEVIVPAIAWTTTYSPLQQYGLKLRVVDVELDSLNIDVAQLEAALTPRTRAILAVSILGNPAALDVQRAFADKHGLHFLEDNCESLDASLNGKKCGTFGDINTFSFFFSHHISTMEGGMILTDDRELWELSRCLRAHGWVRDLPPDSTLYTPNPDSEFEAYRFIMPGYNVRPIEMFGAIGREQLKKLPAMTAQRRKNMALFYELFGKDERFIIQKENGVSSSFCFPMIIRPGSGLERKAVFDAMRKADIGFRIITGGCFTRHDQVSHYDFTTVDDLPNAKLAHDQGFFVGNHPFDLTPQITKLHEVLA